LRYELKIALRYLRARRKEAFISITTIFTAVGVMIGVAALTITLAVMSGFQASLTERVLNFSPQVQILSIEGSISGYGDIQKRVDAVSGVSGSEPYIVGQGMLSSGRGIGGVVIRGVEPDNPVVQAEWGKYVDRGSLTALAKSYSEPGANAAKDAPLGAIAVGVDLLEKLKATLGDRVRLVVPLAGPDGSMTTRTGDFVIGAVFDSGMNFVDTNIAFMDLGRAQEFFGRADRVDAIDVHLVNLDLTQKVSTELREIYKRPYVVRNWIEVNESAAGGFELLKRVYALVLTLLIAVAAFNLVATLIMVVMEKRKDIAVLISMGATRRDVRLIFVLKGMIVGVAGTTAGLILGALGCFLLARYHFIHISREIYGISTLPIAADPSSFALVALASIALCLLATVYPARQASREMPVEVFRS
jgi:lipoprotein-releasing system permease protein